ncbi:penicillin-binding protein 2 [Spiribacter sp. C176]|uniref:Peptidoglycan D,D-transpeptidase FtsI n=1 Tax=Spiribacter salilacus TaxID=2664894 RepID=A0A6N7QQH9_9GAMM|nr:penicillin-binding protein 2 [Spiribacter salilacus]MRH78666.1 penicillin-binding protein 2 [Spiribacter salilacus]
MSNQRLQPRAWRRWLVIVGLMLLPLVLLGRAVTLQLYEGAFLQGQGDQRHLRVETLVANRGVIYDRNGESLAISAPVQSIWANPQVLLDENADASISAVAELVGLDARVLEQTLTSRANREFVYIRRHISPELAEQVVALEIPGVHLQREYRRFYPAGEVTGHVLGFTDVDDKGQSGVEYAYNDWLSGVAGAKRVLRDRYGRNIEDVELLRDARPGKDLHLSIDQRLQYIAYRELKAAVERRSARGGSVVLMDVHSGEILAMVNQPAFNPNRRSDIVAERYRNRAVTDVFEPGSVMKPLAVAAALAGGKYTPETEIDTAPGYLRVAGNDVRDIRDFGTLTVRGILQKSSNVGVAQMALELEQGRHWQLLADLGFGQSTGVNFPGEASGHLTAIPTERPFEKATLAFGYGLSVTTLQLARAYAAIAADGRLPTPTLLANAPAVEGPVVLDPRVAKALRAMMVDVTLPGGTATQAAIPGYQVSGKTGTSRKIGPEGYAKGRYVSTFAGIAPASNPRFVAVVTIDEPDPSEYYAGPVAGPVFRALMSDALRLYRLSPDAMLERKS